MNLSFYLVQHGAVNAHELGASLHEFNHSVNLCIEPGESILLTIVLVPRTLRGVANIGILLGRLSVAFLRPNKAHQMVNASALQAT